MRKLEIGKNDAGQRMDKYLKKYFREAGSGFLYKMLRKKNIVLNGKKAEGNSCEGRYHIPVSGRGNHRKISGKGRSGTESWKSVSGDAAGDSL